MNEKEKKKARGNLCLIHNSIRSAWSMRTLKTWFQFWKLHGFDDRTSAMKQPQGNNITFPEIKDIFAQELADLEASFPSSEEKKPILPLPIKEQAIPLVLRREQDKNLIQEVVTATPILPAAKLSVTKENRFTAENNYGFTQSPKEKGWFSWFQKKAIAQAVEKIVEKKYSSILVIGQTGCGKTFITAGIERALQDLGFHNTRTMSYIQSVYFGKKTIMNQTGRVFKDLFGLEPNVDIECLNIESIRSKRGSYFVKTTTTIEDGEEVEKFEWRRGVHPSVIYVDESQGVKNGKTKQTRCIGAYNRLPINVRCAVHISATPFARVSDAKVFATGTGRSLDHIPGFMQGTVLSEETWPAYSRWITGDTDPEEYNAAAVDRLVDDLEEYIVRVKGVKPQFNAENKVEVIQFRSYETKKFYFTAQERAQRDAEKIKAMEGSGVSMCLLAVLTRFAVAAELCHAEVFAEDMYEAWKRGKAPVCACKFKTTIIKAVEILITKYGISRDNISLIWGGGQTKLTKKQKAKAQIKEMADKLAASGMSVAEILETLGLSDEEVDTREIKKYPPEWRLDTQDMDERQREIDAFQSGRSQFCFYTLKAGGVGLSLHHSDELTGQWSNTQEGFAEWLEEIKLWNSKLPPEKQVKPGKVRRKESGFTFEEDIKFINVRERETFVCVTFNAFELVQGVGRVPRLTSLSKTVQHIRCYDGTVEMHMADVYSVKLTCLSAVVRQREDWQPLILGSDKQQLIKEICERTRNAEKDESSLIDANIDEEEEEE